MMEPSHSDDSPRVSSLRGGPQPLQDPPIPSEAQIPLTLTENSDADQNAQKFRMIGMKRHLKEVLVALVKRFVLPETTLLVALCTWDMLYTLYCVRAGLAKEANPALKTTLTHSNAEFLIVKGSTFLVPVVVLEVIRSHRPKLVTFAMRFGFIAYAVIYIGGSIALMGTI